MTVKMRTGWDTAFICGGECPVPERAGASAVAMQRTRVQMYDGESRLENLGK